MTNEQAEQSQFAGWAILEIFGHQRYAGYVSTQAFGTAVMFRIDVPALEERERAMTRPGYVGNTYAPAGTKVKAEAVQGYTKLFGVGAIYAMTPCSQEAALKAVEEIQPRPMMIVELPKAIAAIAGAVDRTCLTCGRTPEEGHTEDCTAESDEDEDDSVDAEF